MATRPSIAPLDNALDYWNIMLYSDPGTGKTVFAGQDDNVLFMAPESDDGLFSAQTMGSTAKFVENIKSWNDVKNAYEWWDENPEDLANVNVLVIDSISEMQRLAKEAALEFSADEKRRKGRDPEKMELQDYGVMHEMLENMVRGFNDLQVNVLWTATAKKVKDQDEVEFIVPDLQGKNDYGVALKMAALMTCFGYMRVEIHDIPAPTEDDDKATRQVRRRVIYWEDTGTIRGKDRTNALKPFTVGMTLRQMRLAIAGKMKRGADGKIVKLDAAPAKKAVKKVAVKAAPKPEEKKEESLEKLQNPANTPDTAADISDSVPQYTDAGVSQQNHSEAENAVAKVEKDGVVEVDAVEA